MYPLGWIWLYVSFLYTLSSCEVIIAQQWYNSALQTVSRELQAPLRGIWNRVNMAIVFLYAFYNAQWRLSVDYLLCLYQCFVLLTNLRLCYQTLTIKHLFCLPFLMLSRDRQPQLLYGISSSHKMGSPVGFVAGGWKSRHTELDRIWSIICSKCSEHLIWQEALPLQEKREHGREERLFPSTLFVFCHRNKSGCFYLWTVKYSAPSRYD